MSEHLKRASKVLGIPVARLRRRDGLTPAEEAAYEQWRLTDHYHATMRVPLAAIAKGTGIDLARLRKPKELTPKERLRECAFVIFYVTTEPTAGAIKLAKKFRIAPRLVQQVINLKANRSIITKNADGSWDIPDDWGSIGDLRKGKLAGLLRRLNESEALLDGAFDFTGGPGQPQGKDHYAPDPLLGVLLAHADNAERIAPLIEALGELTEIVERAAAAASGQVAHRPLTADWVQDAAALLERSGVSRETCNDLLASDPLGVTRGAFRAWDAARAK